MEEYGWIYQINLLRTLNVTVTQKQNCINISQAIVHDKMAWAYLNENNGVFLDKIVRPAR